MSVKLSVIIPVFNEEKTIAELLNRVVKEKTPKEIIIVDDGSTDNTLSEIRNSKHEIRNKDTKIKIFNFKKNCGKGAAVRKGIENATGDVLIIQDADLEYNPNDYQRLLLPILQKKTQVVYGNRLKELKFKLWGVNKTSLPLHYLINRFLSFLTNVLYGSNLTDMETCYKMMTREVYQKLNLSSSRFEIEPEITAKILKLGYKILEVPIQTKPRSYNEGKKIKAGDAVRAFFTLFKFAGLRNVFKKTWFLFVFIICAFLFRQSFGVYFSQDDFFRFKMSRVEDIISVLNFFSFKNSNLYGFYRPLSINIYSYLGQKIFGLNYGLFHAFNFTVFSFNVFLVYKVSWKLFKKKDMAIFGTLIYSLASFHLTSLSYLSAVEELLVAFFFFLTVNLYLNKNNFAILTFVLALLSRETAVSLPAVLFLLGWRKSLKFSRVLPFVFILISYLFARWYFGLIPNGSDYIISLSLKSIVNNYFWYFLWGIGAPESLVDFVNNFKINESFFQASPVLGRLIILFLIILLVNLTIGLVKTAAKSKLKNMPWFFIFWFVITLSPFIVLVNHRFAFYLEIPFFGLAGLFTYLVYDFKKTKYLFLLIFFLLSYLTVNYYSKTYWAINRAKASQKLIISVRGQYPVLSRGSIIFFKNDQNYQSPSREWGGTSTQAKNALSGCNALNFIYGDESLQCFFEDDGFPILAEKNKIVYFKAVIN